MSCYGGDEIMPWPLRSQALARYGFEVVPAMAILALASGEPGTKYFLLQ